MRRTENTTQSHDHAFSLIELLLAMTILLILMVTMALLVTDSERVSASGTSRARLVSRGRSAIQLLTDDLQHAVATTGYEFNLLEDELALYAYPASELSFHALQNDSADTNRAVVKIDYFVRATSNGYQLVREVWRRSTGAWLISDGVAAYHVANFACSTTNGAYEIENATALPPYLDVLIELLDDETALEIADMQSRGMAATNIEQIVDRKAIRFTTRVAFPNHRRYETE